MRNALFDSGPRDRLASAGLLVLRLGVGGMMAIGHGWPKVGKFGALKDDWFVPAFAPFVSPPVSLMVTIGAELGAAVLLALGLLTRPAAALLVLVMGVAALLVHAGDPLFMTGAGASKEPALLYLIPAVVLLITGGGGFSLDALVGKGKPRRRYA